MSKDITASVLARRSITKKTNSFARKFLPILIVCLGLVGVFKFATASADTITWSGHNGTTSDGLCSDVSSDPSITGQNWLFILTSPDGVGPYTLTASFSPATTPDPAVVTGTGTGSIHFTVNTAIGAQLLSASATGGTSNSVLTVSHCTVGKGTSTVTTTLHNAAEQTVTVGSPVSLGAIMHDLATVTPSGTTAPTGSVSFTFYTNGACSGDGTAAGTIALNGANPGVAHPSTSEGPLGAGNYGFKASWPGDANYTGNTSSCENFTVNQAQLSVATNIHDANHAIVTSVSLGSIVHDTASLTGAVTGFTTPAVTFTFYSNLGCTGDGTSVANTGDDQGDASLVRSADSSALAAGSYAYKASVAGNANYLGDDSDCEPLTVNKAQLTVTTNVHNAAHQDITNTSVPLGSVTHDTATVTGGVSGFPLPAVSFTFTTSYTDSCANGAAVANNGTEGSAVKSADSSALGAGSYAYRASVASDSNYIGGNSVCEPFNVNKAQLAITTDIHNANHQIVTSVGQGSVVHDTATVTGAVSGFATQPVTFTFYANNSCFGTGTSVANTGTDQGNASAVRSADSAALAPGSYSYSASVAGNDNYLGATATCEPLTVVGFWCSPGFWATALSQNRTAVLKYLADNSSNHLDLTTFLYKNIPSSLHPAALKKGSPSNPTLAAVLLSPSTYGGPAFNSVADYIASVLGWGGTQFTGENCPLDAHGNFTLTTLTL
jgi:hypothetical protein